MFRISTALSNRLVWLAPHLHRRRQHPPRPLPIYSSRSLTSNRCYRSSAIPMREVGDRFQNMYYAAQGGNWALALHTCPST